MKLSKPRRFARTVFLITILAIVVSRFLWSHPYHWLAVHMSLKQVCLSITILIALLLFAGWCRSALLAKLEIATERDKQVYSPQFLLLGLAIGTMGVSTLGAVMLIQALVIQLRPTMPVVETIYAVLLSVFLVLFGCWGVRVLLKR